jgi:hypothetical protein
MQFGLLSGDVNLRNIVFGVIKWGSSNGGGMICTVGCH